MAMKAGRPRAARPGVLVVGVLLALAAHETIRSTAGTVDGDAALEAPGMSAADGLSRWQHSPPASQESEPTERFAEFIRRPDGPPVIELDTPDETGRRAHVACSTCHTLRTANQANRRPADLDAFHQGMQFAHGEIACYACHNPRDADTLRLADGSPLEYRDVMQLCAQCHGPQARDYAHRSHGGMNGYWDLRRGERIRANCIDCHDPHLPRFPKMVPTFKPRDRFLTPHGTRGASQQDHLREGRHE